MTLLAAYNFDEASGNVVDVTGSGHDLTLALGNRAAGHTNRGLQSGSTTEASSARTNGAIFGQTAARTLMCWYWRTGTASCWAVEMHNTAGDTGRWGIRFGGVSGAVAARGRSAAGAAEADASVPSLNAWHHYAATYDGATLRTFINGTLAASAALAGPLLTDADVLWLLTSAPVNADTIDDLRVYDEALDAATIAGLMTTPVAPAAEVHSIAAAVSGTGTTAAINAKTAGLAAGTASLGGVTIGEDKTASVSSPVASSGQLAAAEAKVAQLAAAEGSMATLSAAQRKAGLLGASLATSGSVAATAVLDRGLRDPGDYTAAIEPVDHTAAIAAVLYDAYPAAVPYDAFIRQEVPRG